MKNRWLTFFIGIITVKVTGKGLERFINTLVKNGIYVWNVKRNGIQSLTFKMKLNDINKLRQVRRGSGLRIKFLGRKGLPFLFKRLLYIAKNKNKPKRKNKRKRKTVRSTKPFIFAKCRRILPQSFLHYKKTVYPASIC